MYSFMSPSLGAARACAAVALAGIGCDGIDEGLIISIGIRGILRWDGDVLLNILFF
jgi:hypothetical protein